MAASGFDYDGYNELEKRIGPIEEIVIRSQFQTVLLGNSDFESWSTESKEEAYQNFRHGWICCRLFLE